MPGSGSQGSALTALASGSSSVCEIARNSDPLRAVFASNRDPSVCHAAPFLWLRPSRCSRSGAIFLRSRHRADARRVMVWR